MRRWLALRPDEMDRLRASKPSGPLALTHRTGRRKNSPGTERRFDSVWVSRHWAVRDIEHLYEKGIGAAVSPLPAAGGIPAVDGCSMGFGCQSVYCL